jgi:pimeloyl-ACP methyl ester carboxylesterase
MAQVMSPLWDDFAAVAAPLTLVRGSTSPVVDDEDVAEALRRQPGLEVLIVDGAGHSVQGDRPVELAALLRERLD